MFIPDKTSFIVEFIPGGWYLDGAGQGVTQDMACAARFETQRDARYALSLVDLQGAPVSLRSAVLREYRCRTYTLPSKPASDSIVAEILERYTPVEILAAANALESTRLEPRYAIASKVNRH